jgi:serine/threonine-protein kinase
MFALAGWQSVHWILVLIGYGVLIPNTWKRATVVLTTVALIPILLHGFICLIDPDIGWFHAGIFMLGTTLLMGFAAAMVIFGAHRIESLRREVLEARRLGQYQLGELLGTGGMGEVYRGEHVLLRRPCAIKLIRPDRAGDPKNLLRFEREVQATATLTNWNTVEIYDYGHAPDGTFYYVMEYLPGLTLDQFVSRYGPLPPERAVHFLRQVCGALLEAHSVGLIHRDLKPGNIIVGERGGLPDVAKLLDFGLVQAPRLDGEGEKLTQLGALVGTPAYMSPEQAGGEEELNPRSDIYSLGAVAYFLLTGRPPFVRKTAVQVLAAHLHERTQPLTELRGDVPTDLEVVVLRCLEKDPKQRCQSAAELDESLARCSCSGRWDREQATRWWREHRPTPPGN